MAMFEILIDWSLEMNGGFTGGGGWESWWEYIMFWLGFAVWVQIKEFIYRK
jgi:hypothetical protein